MDVSSPRGKSVLDCSLGLQSSANQSQHPSTSVYQDLVWKLETAIGESLSLKEVVEEGIKDVKEGSFNFKDVGEESVDVKVVGDAECTSSGNDISGVEKSEEGNCTPKVLNKCATFPMQEEKPEAASGEDHCNQGYSLSVSLPSPLKLLSAMKGSREKEGLSTEKLTVKWAPDVYDPPTTLMSHTVRGNKQQKPKNKKNLKKDGKKKSNSSRGKDKKQYRKGGGSERSQRSLDPREMTADGNDEFGDVGVEPYCGSSFLINSFSNMHFPVAEAL